MDTAIAFIAHDGGPGMNVHIDGMPCIDCDPHFDPMRRTGVPCQYAYAHAKHTVHAWWFNGIRDARVSLVEVADTGDYASMVAVARERLAARDGMASAPSTTAT